MLASFQSASLPSEPDPAILLIANRLLIVGQQIQAAGVKDFIQLFSCCLALGSRYGSLHRGRLGLIWEVCLGRATGGGTEASDRLQARGPLQRQSRSRYRGHFCFCEASPVLSRSVLSTQVVVRGSRRKTKPLQANSSQLLQSTTGKRKEQSN